jgi:hypothetical protein
MIFPFLVKAGLVLAGAEKYGNQNLNPMVKVTQAVRFRREKWHGKEPDSQNH